MAKKKNKKVKVKDARKILREQEAQNLLDMDQVCLNKYSFFDDINTRLMDGRQINKW